MHLTKIGEHPDSYSRAPSHVAYPVSDSTANVSIADAVKFEKEKQRKLMHENEIKEEHEMQRQKLLGMNTIDIDINQENKQQDKINNINSSSETSLSNFNLFESCIIL